MPNIGGTPQVLTFDGTKNLANNNNLGAGPFLGFAFAPTAGAFTLGGGSVTLNGDDSSNGDVIANYSPNTQTVNMPITVVGTGRQIEAANGNIVVGGPISGSGGLTTAGSGTVTLAAANGYTGVTRAAAGSLTVGHQLALQNSTLDMNAADSGTVSFGVPSATLGGLQGTRDLSLGGAAVSVGGLGTSTTYSGNLSGVGSLNKIGAGSLTLGGRQQLYRRHDNHERNAGVYADGQTWRGWRTGHPGRRHAANSAVWPTGPGRAVLHWMGRQYGFYTSGLPAVQSYFATKTPNATQNTSAWGTNLYTTVNLANCGNFPQTPVAFTTNLVFEAFWQGTFVAQTAGTYGFQTSSDDGSSMYVDGTLVVSNEASQGVTARAGTIVLGPGPHSIAIHYENSGGACGFGVQYQPPGASGFTPLPNSDLFTATPGWLNHPVTVTADSTIDVGGNVLPVAATTLAIGSNVLSITGHRRGRPGIRGRDHAQRQPHVRRAGTESLGLGAVADSGTGHGITKAGTGRLVLASAAYTGPTTIQDGAVSAAAGLPAASELVFAGAGSAMPVLESNGIFSGTIGTSAGNVQWSGNGGFAALGGPLAVQLNGGVATLDWAAHDSATATAWSSIRPRPTTSSISRTA